MLQIYARKADRFCLREISNPAIEQAIAQILSAGKAPGILMANEPLAKRYLELGALFVAVGVDTTLLARGAEALAARFIEQPVTSVNNNKSVY